MKRWTDKEDGQLIAWGCCFADGYAFVAQHDLGRSEAAGRRRIAWLRKNKPALVRHIEAEISREPEDDDAPPRRQSKMSVN